MTDSYLRRVEAAEEAEKLQVGRHAFTSDINTHLDDIIVDVNRVKKAFEEANNELEHEPKLTGEELKNRLCDISNLLDDLYNQLRGL